MWSHGTLGGKVTQGKEKERKRKEKGKGKGERTPNICPRGRWQSQRPEGLQIERVARVLRKGSSRAPMSGRLPWVDGCADLEQSWFVVSSRVSGFHAQV